MTAEQVIKLGEAASVSELRFSDLSTVFLYGFAVLIVLWTIQAILIFKGYEGLFGCFLSLLLPIILFCICVTDISRGYDNRVSNQLTDWRKNVAYPYIESLYLSNNEIVYIKLDPEMTSQDSYSYTTRDSTLQLTPLVVSFKGKGIETVTDWIESNMSLTDKESPYIQFNRLTVDLGHGITPGLYNKRIFLPESYEFTDIK